MVSFRWINFCLERKQIIRDLKKHRLPHLLPNIKKMPIESFQNIQFMTKGFDDREKFVLKETVNLLGGVFIDWKQRFSLKKENKIYILCADMKKVNELIRNDEILKSLQLDSDNIIIKRSVWLFKCQFKGELLD